MSHKQNDIIREMAEEGHIKGREIKFRAWVAGWGMMFDVEAIDFEHGKVKVRNDYTLDSDVGRYKAGTEVKNYEEFGLEEVELMLCSPFTDINGKEICQGDRVRVEDLGEGEVVFEKGCLLYIQDGAKVGEQGFWCALCDPIDDGKKVEVIGTIYEPKEGI